MKNPPGRGGERGKKNFKKNDSRTKRGERRNLKKKSPSRKKNTSCEKTTRRRSRTEPVPSLKTERGFQGGGLTKGKRGREWCEKVRDEWGVIGLAERGGKEKKTPGEGPKKGLKKKHRNNKKQGKPWEDKQQITKENEHSLLKREGKDCEMRLGRHYKKTRYEGKNGTRSGQEKTGFPQRKGVGVNGQTQTQVKT